MPRDQRQSDPAFCLTQKVITVLAVLGVVIWTFLISRLSVGSCNRGGIPVQLSRPTVPESAEETDWTRHTTSLPAINWLSQERVYHHHPVFSRMMPPSLPLEEKYVTEFTGLRIPRNYDCQALYPEPGALPHDYYMAVPSRWVACNEHQYLMKSGLNSFRPSHPIIDEEYIETAVLYELALQAESSLNIIEMGARWGTWGFRAVAANRRFGAALPFQLLFVETERVSCDAIATVAQLNNFDPANITVLCRPANAADVHAWVADRVPSDHLIDVVDIDIQGAEFDIVPELLALFRERVKVVVIGTHAPSRESNLREEFQSPPWRLLRTASYSAMGSDCLSVLRKPDKYAAYHELQELLRSDRCAPNPDQTPFGPLLIWDGELIAVNMNLVSDAQYAAIVGPLQ